jgi:hypothetical protein
MFCGSEISIRMKLLHRRYCSTEHQEAYFEAMDRLGLKRLIAAKPPLQSYEPCTRQLGFAEQSQAQPVRGQAEPKAPKFSPRIRPRLELSQGEAAAVAGL